MLGAGGAARAAAWALRQAGAEVTIWNRTASRAKRLARELGVEAASRPGAAELLVNATSVGLRREDSLAGLPLVDARVWRTSFTEMSRRRLPAGRRSAARDWSTGSRCSCARARAASRSGPAASRPSKS